LLPKKLEINIFTVLLFTVCFRENWVYNFRHWVKSL